MTNYIRMKPENIAYSQHITTTKQIQKKEKIMKKWKKEQVTVFECKDRKELGSTAAADFSKALIKVLEKKEIATVVFAAAPSQNEFLAAIVADKSIDFSRIRAFNLDEYIGLSVDSPETFGNFLRRSLYSLREFNKVEFLNSESSDPEKEAKRYAGLLAEQPIDIVCMGIGENGHLAFNDPPVADFNDPKAVKVVELELPCRSQQVNDGCFPTIEDVPTHALTLTIPTLGSATYHFCMVPATSKAQAVYNTLNGEISTKCPATIMRTWVQPVLYLDPDSASLLNK